MKKTTFTVDDALAILDNLRFVAQKYNNPVDAGFLEIGTFLRFLRYQASRKPELLTYEARELYPTLVRGNNTYNEKSCYLKRVERKPQAQNERPYKTPINPDEIPF